MLYILVGYQEGQRFHKEVDREPEDKAKMGDGNADMQDLKQFLIHSPPQPTVNNHLSDLNSLFLKMRYPERKVSCPSSHNLLVAEIELRNTLLSPFY